MRQNYRPPAAAGRFYPSDAAQLTDLVDNYLEATITGRPRILIVPHAGYIYSGEVAGAAFATASGFDTVILLGVSHHFHFNDVRLSSVERWTTPLGDVPLNQAVIAKLLEHHTLFQVNETAHGPEHGLEVQLPFLQRQLPDAVVVPILLSHLSNEALPEVAESLLQILDEKTLLVISSDLSHYPPPNEAERIDAATIQTILNNDLGAFEKQLQMPIQSSVSGLVTCACGSLAIKVGMSIATKSGPNKVHLLRYANSGTLSGAVGYAGIAYFS